MSNFFDGPSDDTGQLSRAEAQHQRRKSAQRSRTRTLLLLISGLCVLAIVVGIGVFTPMIRGLFTDNDYPGPGNGTVDVTIDKGASGRDIGKVLQEKDVVLSADAFVDAAKENTKSASIQPGTYRLKSQMRAADALVMLLDPLTRVTDKVVIREGLRTSETYDLLKDATGLSVEAFKSAVSEDQVKIPAMSQKSAEGWLFPATYDFPPQSPAPVVLQKMVDKTTSVLTSLGVPEAQRREVLIKASLIQAEAGKDEDMPKIARVIQNRLERNQKLQLDTTVLYAVGKRSVTTTPDDRKNPSPFNTYAHTGLPVGPICSPGEKAIKAALNPEPGPWMYFVAVNPDTKETRYAVTDAEHAANVELFRQWLRSKNS